MQAIFRLKDEMRKRAARIHADTQTMHTLFSRLH
jgi:hypothetical protein